MPDSQLGVDGTAPDEQVAKIGRGILGWFDRHRRDLPWRRSRDPYQILVAEVMLQQTQVDRVIPYYHDFLTRFPTVEALAIAPTADVIRIWAGLGYNRRAVNLQRAAKAIVEAHAGVFPRSVGELRKLPGIGDYTAGAIACFAFEQDVSFLDTNMRRVVHRVFLGGDDRLMTRDSKTTMQIAERLLPAGDGWRWNQALIEFGAMQCTSRKPLCIICPLQAECQSFPVAQQLGSRRSRGASTSAEEPFVGSNRYYRGRVIDALRAQPDGSDGIGLRELGESVRDGFGNEHLPWLDELVRGLQRDGLAHIAEPKAQYEARQPSTTDIRIKLP